MAMVGWCVYQYYITVIWGVIGMLVADGICRRQEVIIYRRVYITGAQ